MTPAIFLDRDGVIIENRSTYVRSWNDVAIYGQALTALARIKSSPYKIFIVTNQSAIGRGIISLDTVLEINHQLLKVIQQTGGRIDEIFLCPHAPQDHCECRKPKPGLILQAARAYPLDLNRSILIGDALSDILAAQAAGIPQKALVRTGLGTQQDIPATLLDLGQLRIYDTLDQALTAMV